MELSAAPAIPVKKRWRVGTLSMGVALILLGVSLFISAWRGAVVFDTLLTYWPIVFVLLGCEILMFVYFSRRDMQVIYYDLYSIFFVSFLCLCSLLFSFLTTTGLMTELRNAVSYQEVTKDLPIIQQEIPKAIDRIVVQTYNLSIKIDRNASREIHLLGSYRMDSSQAINSALKSEDVMTIRTIGNTMYVVVKDLPRKRGIVNYGMNASMVLVLPQEVPVDVRDIYNNELKK